MTEQEIIRKLANAYGIGKEWNEQKKCYEYNFNENAWRCGCHVRGRWLSLLEVVCILTANN